MSELRWIDETDAESLQRLLKIKPQPSLRKLRLYSCATLRNFWVELTEPARELLLALEERVEAGTAHRPTELVTNLWLSQSARSPAWYCMALTEAAGVRRYEYLRVLFLLRLGRAEQGHTSTPSDYEQVALLRDIFGNPFRPVTFAPEWRTEAAVGIAAKMYDSREFGNMPILADALQDAGCEHADILSHCRGDGPHVRGCWVVDLVLGKA